MSDYLIKSYHEVFEDNFNEGEGNHVNGQMSQGQVTADNLQEAVQKYYENHLLFPFVKENISDNEENEFFLHDSVAVDVENSAASDYDIKKWQSGEIKLYSNLFAIEVSELVPVTTDNFFKL